MILFEYDEEAHLKSRERKVEERTRAKDRLDFAKKSIEEGISLETISRITSIPIEELKKLK